MLSEKTLRVVEIWGIFLKEALSHASGEGGEAFRAVGVLGAKALRNELVCGASRETWAFLLRIAAACVQVCGEPSAGSCF